MDYREEISDDCFYIIIHYCDIDTIINLLSCGDYLQNVVNKYSKYYNKTIDMKYINKFLNNNFNFGYMDYMFYINHIPYIHNIACQLLLHGKVDFYWYDFWKEEYESKIDKNNLEVAKDKYYNNISKLIKNIFFPSIPFDIGIGRYKTKCDDRTNSFFSAYNKNTYGYYKASDINKIVKLTYVSLASPIIGGRGQYLNVAWPIKTYKKYYSNRTNDINLASYTAEYKEDINAYKCDIDDITDDELNKLQLSICKAHRGDKSRQWRICNYDQGINCICDTCNLDTARNINGTITCYYCDRDYEHDVYNNKEQYVRKLKYYRNKRDIFLSLRFGNYNKCVCNKCGFDIGIYDRNKNKYICISDTKCSTDAWMKQSNNLKSTPVIPINYDSADDVLY